MTNSTDHAISIFVIATKSYLDCAHNLIDSAMKWHVGESRVQFILLTDRNTESLRVANTSSFYDQSISNTKLWMARGNSFSFSFNVRALASCIGEHRYVSRC